VPGSLVGDEDAVCRLENSMARRSHPNPRSPAVRSALRITWISIAWSAAGGTASITSGVLAGSLALIGSGASVFIDLTSSIVLVWRFGKHEDHPTAERLAHVIAASALTALAVGLAVASGVRLATGAQPDASAAGLAVAAASVLALPAIAVRKYQVAPRVPSHALRVDAHITTVGATTALLALAGIGLTDAGVGSADALAAATIAVGAGWLGAGELRRREL
jgi:divalent metal cation (Fe/Co/Zn/Cd) transporter